ncbi:hypothetical protein JR316_0007525 [Psilocybe cubensis]|uniref:Uncharacterized protein n=1 Tax=Psilocybe cubensis TaxID=181762 RepID=A0ACB8GZ52_PSICU|nr:hypothetical protein JR316_0007525 [Psilocybe cubensis]KAH9480923.1 hypothetical protein JR316_0007525 [Psilocybe cubensis]
MHTHLKEPKPLDRHIIRRHNMREQILIIHHLRTFLVDRAESKVESGKRIENLKSAFALFQHPNHNHNLIKAAVNLKYQEYYVNVVLAVIQAKSGTSGEELPSAEVSQVMRLFIWVLGDWDEYGFVYSRNNIEKPGRRPPPPESSSRQLQFDIPNGSMFRSKSAS